MKSGVEVLSGDGLGPEEDINALSILSLLFGIKSFDIFLLLYYIY